MEELVEDDICILNHEKADNAHKRDGEIPVSSYSGDESVASHFALVTAYEDIKKRLKETEKENSFLKKRVRILEEKVRKKVDLPPCSSYFFAPVWMVEHVVKCLKYVLKIISKLKSLGKLFYLFKWNTYCSSGSLVTSY